MSTLTIDTFTAKPAELPPRAGTTTPVYHHFDRQQATAVLAARAINRPLLVRGEPGCGKTQFAYAAAQVLCMPQVSMVVNERTEAEDLFWHYDTLRRLSDANSTQGVKDESTYLSAGPLWWALNPFSAKEFPGKYTLDYREKGDSKAGKDNAVGLDKGVLLLIDEIDKADRAVPNSLLEALGDYRFRAPHTSESDYVECTGAPPLIIITSNDEQALPAAFIRRCLVLDMNLPEEQLVATLSERGRNRYADLFPKVENGDDGYTAIAKKLQESRQRATNAGAIHKPGQAEYFDHLQAIAALREIHGFDADNIEDDLQRLSFEKYPF